MNTKLPSGILSLASAFNPAPRRSQAKAAQLLGMWAALACLSNFNLQLFAVPLGTAFTYHGRLADGTNAAQGTYDFRFAIYDAAGEGALIAGPLTHAAVAVNNGAFVALLDFGSEPFTGQARWLEIGVRSNGVPSDFTTLTPRQQLTPTPYALYASNAGAAAAVTGSLPASQLTGTLPDARLSTNVALLNTSPRFAGSVRADDLTSDNSINWAGSALRADQSGSIRLGDSRQTNTTPYLDFHYGVTTNQDFNVRLINTQPDQLEIAASGWNPMMGLNPSEIWLRAAGAITFRAPNWAETFRVEAEGDVVVDPAHANAGALTPGLRFGHGNSGEGMASKRTAGGNQYGLDLYTAGQPRLSIGSSGKVGIGTSDPAAELEVAGRVKATELEVGGVALAASGGTLRVNNQPILSGQVQATNLAPGSVTSAAIAEGAVGAAQIAQGAVTAEKVETVFDRQSVASCLVITNPLGSNWVFASSLDVLGSGNFVVGSSDAGLGGRAYLYDAHGTRWMTFDWPWPAGDPWVWIDMGIQVSFGESVAAVGDDKVLVGAPGDVTYPEYGNFFEGAAYLFHTNGSLLRKFSLGGFYGYFGQSVATVGGDRLLIGCPGHSAAFLFDTNGTLLATYTNSPPSAGTRLGSSLAAVGTDRALIGASGGTGTVFLINLSGQFLLTITNPTPSSDDQFGASLAPVGNSYLLIGAPGDDAGAANAGAAYLYDLTGQLVTTLTNPLPAAQDAFGCSVAALTPDVVLVGATHADAGGTDAGRLYLFNTNGTLLATLGKPTPAAGDHLGAKVLGLGPDRVLVSVPGDDTGLTNSGAVWLFGYGAYTPGLIADGTRAGSVNSSMLAEGAVTSGKLTAGAVTEAKLAAAAVTITKIAPGAVGTTQLAPGAVTSAAIADGSIADADVATAGISASKIIGGDLRAERLNVGQGHSLSGSFATIAGGEGNSVGGPWATIPGGSHNVANGKLSFAAGSRARAEHDGAFVWADSTATDFSSTGSNQFVIRATGGVGIGTNDPQSTLHVNGTITASSFLSTAVAGIEPPPSVTPILGMIWIKPGTFIMGSPTNEVDRDSNEGPQTVVTLTKGFWMAHHEVTQGEYQTVMGSNPSYFTGDLNLPVEMVNWDEATNYCWLLTQGERTAGRLPAGWGYRLPTEAEWEYACRAWTTTRFSYGDDPGYASLTNYAWFYLNSNARTTHPVAQKLANPWGLVDMHGNVFEWCQDRYGTYPGGSVTDPQGPGAGSFRVVRGGSWNDYGWYCRSAYRYYYNPSSRRYFIGFRVVLAPGQP